MPGPPQRIMGLVRVGVRTRVAGSVCVYSGVYSCVGLRGWDCRLMMFPGVFLYLVDCCNQQPTCGVCSLGTSFYHVSG